MLEEVQSYKRPRYRNWISCKSNSRKNYRLKQTTYIAEVQSQLHYQKGVAEYLLRNWYRKILRNHRLVEQVFNYRRRLRNIIYAYLHFEGGQVQSKVLCAISTDRPTATRSAASKQSHSSEAAYHRVVPQTSVGEVSVSRRFGWCPKSCFLASALGQIMQKAFPRMVRQTPVPFGETASAATSTTAPSAVYSNGSSSSITKKRSNPNNTDEIHMSYDEL